MITEDYVSYEVAKLLKEKGFDGQTHGNMSEIPCVCYITHQIAMKWLREKGLYITINFNPTDQDNITWWVQIMSKENYKELLDAPTYEQAVEAALKYCLTKLI